MWGCMPRPAKELSAVEVRRLGRGVHNVGGVAGLLMQVSNNGAQSWLLRVRVGDKRREIGLGLFPEVSLARAREKAAETEEAIRSGIDPVEARKAARSALLASQRQVQSAANGGSEPRADVLGCHCSQMQQ